MRIRLSVVLFLVQMALVASCSEDKPKETCPAGALNCACLAEDACNDGFECKEGFCVKAEEACPAGTQGCPCLTDGSCNSAEGPALECVEGLCVPEGTVVGGLGDPCDSEKLCGILEGTQLECKEGTCQLPGEECPAGTLECPCDEGKCAEGLECTDGKCLAQAGSGLVVGNSDVRACDVLIELAGADAAFSADVLGVTARDGDRLAISFSARVDAALGVVAALVAADGGTLDAGGVTPVEVSCFDRLGKAVAEPEVAFK